MTIHLSFSNRKLKELAKYLDIPSTHVTSFDLPAGWSCPMADKCLSKADRVTGKITDGRHCEFRCYAASIEAFSPSARKNHWDNFDAIRGKSAEQVADILDASIPDKIEVMRIHSSGDFFNPEYFQGWILLAERRPEITFFGYTKQLDFVNADKPDNFHLVYSYGGRMDDKVTPDTPIAYVVETVADALDMGLTAVCKDNPADDFDWILEQKSFALTIHGTQPAQS